MNKKKAWIVGILILAVIGVGFYFGYPIITKNRFVGMELQIEQLHQDSLNELSTMSGTITLSGSAIKSKDDFLLKVMHEATEGRYGPNGAQQTILLLTENYPNMDNTLRQQYIRAVEAGYARFADMQSRKLELIRIYKKAVHPDTVPSGSWVAQKYGFPRIDFSKYAIILTEDARKADETKTLDPGAIDPFSKKPEKKE